MSYKKKYREIIMTAGKVKYQIDYRFPIEILVMNCYDCPFRNRDDMSCDPYCGYPESPVADSEITPFEMQSQKHIPNNCPLKKGDTVIKIKR